MNLPRPLLLRVRRSIRRQLAMSPFNTCLTAADSEAKRQKRIQRERKNRMKFPTILLLAAALILIGCLISCVESSKRTTMPDGTRIEEYSKQTDPNVLRFGADVVRAYSPREIRRVREEKSGDVHEIDFVNIKAPRGSRITDKEIRNRWQPVYGPTLP